MMEVRCCCKPENLIGYLPDPINRNPLQTFLTAQPFEPIRPIGAISDEMEVVLPETIQLKVRPLAEGGFAYSSEGHDEATIRALPGFVPAATEAGKGTKKTWRKTWKEK